MRDADKRPKPIQTERPLDEEWRIEQEPPNTQSEDMERQGREEDPDRDWDGQPQDEGDMDVRDILRRQGR